MCTFANNQHDLSELSGGMAGTPFLKVIRSTACLGTVVLLDPNAAAFGRAWCVLELHESTTNAGDKSPAHLYDVAAWIPRWSQNMCRQKVAGDIPALQLDDGNGATYDSVEGDGFFPPEVARKGVQIDIEAADASRPEDKAA